MFRPPHALRPPTQDSLSDGTPAGADLGLLAFIVALHAFPLVGFAAGGAWEPGIVGYATGVVLVAGRELVRECGAYVRAARRSSR